MLIDELHCHNRRSLQLSHCNEEERSDSEEIERLDRCVADKRDKTVFTNTTRQLNSRASLEHSGQETAFIINSERCCSLEETAISLFPSIESNQFIRNLSDPNHSNLTAPFSFSPALVTQIHCRKGKSSS